MNTNILFANTEKTEYCSLSFVTMANPMKITKNGKLKTNATSISNARRAKTFGILVYIFAFIVFLYGI